MRLLQFSKTTYSKHPILFLLAADAVFIALIILCLPFQFESCDDRLMAWTTSGYITGTPDFHTLYMNVIFSWGESQLYTILPHIEWHTWLLLLIHLVSFTAITRCILDTNQRKGAKVSLILLLYLIETYLITNLQFTTTAGLAATAGMLLIMQRKRYNLGVILFLLGSLVRFHSAMFCGLMVAALYPLAILRQGFEKKQLLLFLLCAGGAIGFQSLNSYAYSINPEWKELLEYDKLRGKVHDSPDFWRVYSNPPKGMTRSDFDNWVGTIEYRDVMTTEMLNSCLEEIERETTFLGIPGLKKLKSIPSNLFPLWPWFLILGILIIVYLMNCNNSKERWCLVIGLLVLPLSIAVIVLNTRMAERAFLCGWLPLMLIPACLVEFKNKKTPILFWGVLVVTVAFFTWKKALFGHDNPSASYFQKQELIDCGEEYGAKCFVIDFYSGVDEYPLGIRYQFKNEDIVVKNLKSFSADMVNNDQCVFLLNRKMGEAVVNDLRSEQDGKTNIIPQEICGNNTYSLFKLISE